jgi:hypothetical protein
MRRTVGEPMQGMSHIRGMPLFIPLVGSFLLVFLPALGLLIAGLAKEARREPLRCAAARRR